MNALLGWGKPRISKPRSTLRVLFDCRGPGYSQLIFAAMSGWPLLMEWGGEDE